MTFKRKDKPLTLSEAQDIHDKIGKVLGSCRTQKQLTTARKYAVLALRYIESRFKPNSLAEHIILTNYAHGVKWAIALRETCLNE